MSNLLFCPIDIDLSELVFPQQDKTMELNAAYRQFWSSTLITEKSIIESNLDRILHQLPFKKITTLTHKIQLEQVRSHVDVYPSMTFEDGELNHIKTNEPCGYRIVLKGSNDTLNVFDGKKWKQITLLSIPCCYVINSSSCLHRVEHDPNRETIYVRGFLDTLKHQELIERSLDKYKKYAIFSVN